MSAKVPESQGASSTSWWERLSDRDAQASGVPSLVWVLVAAAVVAVVAVLGWNAWKSSEATGRAEVSAEINRGLELLPGDGLRTYIQTEQRYPDRTEMATIDLLGRSAELGPRGSFASTLVDREGARAYHDKVESALATLAEKEDELGDGEQAWLYWHVRQQLLFYASRSTPDVAARKRLLNEQLAILDRIRSTFGENHAFFGLKPDTDRPDDDLVDLWEAAARADLAFIDAHPEAVALKPDPELEGTITLENGKELKLRFYSRVAPKAVATFVAAARAGVYDGTAFHAVKKEDGVLVGGNPFSRLAPERPAIWSSTVKHPTVPTERSALLPAERGRVAFETNGVAADPFHLVIHLQDPEAPLGAAVFAEVVSGLEHLEPWLELETHDETGLTNPHLPRERLGIATIRVEGALAHPSDDSWKPTIAIPEIPEMTPDERAFYEASGRGPAGASEEDADPEQPGEDEAGEAAGEDAAD